jgi:cytochrome c oxidase subunit 3
MSDRASNEAAVVKTLDLNGRAVLDVSALPTSVFGPRSPVWWGNTLLMFIESMSVCLLVASYFYLRQNFTAWPPPNSNADVPKFHPLPAILLPSIELVVMLLSCILVWVMNRAARAVNGKLTAICVWSLLVLVLLLTASHFYDFGGLGVRWNDNAYAGIVWTLLGLHLTYFFVAAGETFIMGLWIHRSEFDEHIAHDVILTGLYWYWVVAVWILLYAVIYIVARVL